MRGARSPAADVVAAHDRVLGRRPCELRDAPDLSFAELDSRAAALLASGRGRIRVTLAPAGPGEPVGVDARAIVPPFLPGSGRPDGVPLFILMLRLCAPHALVAHLPCCVDAADPPPSADTTVAALLRNLLLARRIRLTGGPRRRLARLGRDLQAIGRMDADDLLRLLHACWAPPACEALCGGAPGGAAVEEVLADPRRLAPEGLDAVGLGRRIEDFGHLLQDWPRLWGVAVRAAGAGGES